MFKTWNTLHKQLANKRYAMQFKWLGFTINQMPQDLIAYQQIIFKLKPQLIIETGVAFGGTSIFFASILEMCGLHESKVIGIDIKLLEQTKNRINNHRLGKNITLIEGSSTDQKIIKQVREIAKGKRTMVFLDSNHTKQHVLRELRAYSPIASYIVVNDTGMEDIGKLKGNNPKIAVRQFLKNNNNFVLDNIDKKIIMTAHPSGYLRRKK